jgi:hypothetical protein
MLMEMASSRLAEARSSPRRNVARAVLGGVLLLWLFRYVRMVLCPSFFVVSLGRELQLNQLRKLACLR